MSLAALFVLLVGGAAPGATPGDAPSAAVAGPDVAVVCPAAFREALQPWLQYRIREGHRPTLVSNAGSADDIRRRIRQVAKTGSLRFVVLVGSVSRGAAYDPTAVANGVPTHYADARVNILWGSEHSIATDNWYAQGEEASDQRPAPTLAVGRLPAENPAELRRLVAKILDYEQCRDFGPWRQRLNVVAGMGGFGPLADMVLESATQYFLTQNIPAAYQLSMTYGSWRSPYCPDPRAFRETTLQRLNEGAWLWVYIGHGYPWGLDHVHVPGGHYPILDVPDMPKLTCQAHRPIALFLSCYAGALDARQACLAEEMLRTPGGPVAILAGSRVTMPYGLGVLATGLMRQCFREHRATLGEAVLAAKQAALPERAADDPQRAMLDGIAAAISPDAKLRAAERAEHVLLMNLLGDPLLRLHYAQEITLDVPARAVAGTRLTVRGRSPLAGQATVELAVRRDRLTFAAPPRDDYPRASDELAQFQETYARANDRRLAMLTVPIQAGRFEVQLTVPEGEPGACQVTMFVEGTAGFAAAAAEVRLVAATQTSAVSFK